MATNVELSGESCKKQSNQTMSKDDTESPTSLELRPEEEVVAEKNPAAGNDSSSPHHGEENEEVVSGSNEMTKTPASLEEYICSYQFAELQACLMFVIIGLVLGSSGIDPHQRPIPYQQLESTGEYILDQTVNHPFEEDTVTAGQALVYAFVIPVIIQLLLCHFIEKNDTVHRTCCVYLAAFGLTLSLTNSIKLYVGYLRPVFYDFCQPDDDYQECTNDARGARLSFPSGHASFSFCGLVLFSFFLERQFGVSRLRIWAHDSSTGQIIMGYRQHVGMRRIVSIFCYSPMLLAGFIAASRVVDNKHFPADVVGGSVLGTAVASLVHSIWFPSWPSLEVEG